MFFRIWTRKESFIKAHGDGMHFPLTGVPCEPGYTAAITVEGDQFDLLSIPYSAARP